MTAADYVSNLDLDDLDDLLTVLEDGTSIVLRIGNANEVEEWLAERVDTLINDAPVTIDPITLYRQYEELPKELLREGGQLIEDAFFSGAVKNPGVSEGVTTLMVEVPEGTHVIQLPGSIYILSRRLVLNLEPMENGSVLATISDKTGPGPKSAITATGSITLSEKEAFHLLGQHDQSSHGRPGGGPAGIRLPGALRAQEGQLTSDQIKGIRAGGHKPEDYDGEGKPIPGTDSWLDAHGVDRKVYEARPMVRYEGSKDSALDKHFAEFPPEQRRFAGRIASQSDGLIMVRKPAPGAEEAGFGKIPPQLRPDNKVVLNNKDKVKREIALKNAIARKEKVDQFTPEDIVNERQTRVDRAKAEVKRMKTSTPADIMQEANQAKDEAAVGLKKAKRSGDPDRIAAAEEKVRKVDFEAQNDKYVARLLDKDPKRALGLAQQEQGLAESALIRAKADPQKTLKNARDAANTQIGKKQDQLDGVAVKYVFPKGEGNGARIEVNQDPQNVKNLVSGKGKVYFIMEGNIKADAALSQVKKEDPRAAVISIPSVTAWNDAETDWVSKKHLTGRDVVLIPDADGIFNPNVANQATKLAGKLRSNGVKNVIVAAPPTIPGRGKNGAIEELTLPSGVKDARKGLDDHIGLGRGTLGDLTFHDTPAPNFDVSDDFKGSRRHSVPNANVTINAISDMAGAKGAGRISINSIEQYTGMPQSSVKGSIKKLEQNGVIKVHHIFNPNMLAEGRRVADMEYDEIKRVTRLAGVSVPDLDIRYVNDLNKHETAAIVEILKPKYLTKPGPPKTLRSKYKNLKVNPRVPKPSTAGTPQKRLVQTAEGAKRYGVAIGQPIPEVAADTTGLIVLSHGKGKNG